MISDTTYALEGIQVSLTSLAKAVMDDRNALDLLIWGQGRVYTITNISCYAWINALVQVERSIHKLKEKAPGFLRVALILYGICSVS